MDNKWIVFNQFTILIATSFQISHYVFIVMVIKQWIFVL